ncbi:UdgX family uracil-DNA binding protein [Cereibacter sphaeroides]|uniref:UdgX family uracil-DNA binding protein n=1 Tax=Cereibacter sphaeroides TaxID=1063 RepID=UPI001F389403|nr:UdgX family uracil-DNA binding protein [Cereibacter sphaeroides]MCE6961325.1 UdgX family uracil-DNA binding protein [Cereibacter sphaeroides]MCE6972061.1 UdgX family uracil-DNA binding protein [Cereibacter sphaeroides]
MHEVVLPRIGTVPAWRREARALAQAGVPAAEVLWRVGEAEADLFAERAPPAAATRQIRLPREAVATFEAALCHADPERFARAYAMLLRLDAGELRWGDRTDPPMRRLLAQEKTVHREIHKMHAFVRFREVPPDGPRRAFAAWFEPDHPVEEAAAPFFARRFGDMDWVIVTPEVTTRFVDGTLSFTETVSRERPPPDATEDLWRTYYAGIFNPARLMPKAMQAEMPKRYWKNLPEAALIPALIRGAEQRARDMQAAAPTEPPARRAAIERQRQPSAPPPPGSLDELRAQAAECRRCNLWSAATQVVFGEGPASAALMVVGEQPGDREDLVGRPFVGPAGQVFDEEAGKAGLDRRTLFVTNAVKHFKFTPRGKRRIHQKPDAGEMTACRWWLDLEREMVRPKVIVAMGATALASLTGSGAGLLRRRGQVETLPDGTPVLVTVHPSYILRLPDEAAREAERARFRDDLRAARYLLETHR